MGGRRVSLSLMAGRDDERRDDERDESSVRL